MSSTCRPSRTVVHSFFLLACFVAIPTSAHAQIVTGAFSDASWIHNPGVTGLAGGHTVSASAYNYYNEQFELSVKSSGWAFDGNAAATNGTLIHSGKAGDAGEYRSYSDITGATLADSGQHWTINLKLKGDYKWIGDKAAAENAEGLKGHYVVYFGQVNTGNHWSFNIADGSGLSSSFSTTGVKLFEDSNVAGDSPPYGSGIDVTFEDDPNESQYSGYSNQVSTNQLTARTLYNAALGIYELEFRYDYSGGPITASILSNLDYLYIGAGFSNPSSSADLFANDHFTRMGTTGVGYDTLMILSPVPEPSSMLLIGAAACVGYVSRRHLKARSLSS